VSIWGLLSFRIIKSVDVALQLSQTYRLPVVELGHAFVFFFFSILIALIDSTLDDWGPSTDNNDMDIDFRATHNFKGNEQMRRTNSFMAIEVLAKLTETRKSMLILRLLHLNMYVCHYSYSWQKLHALHLYISHLLSG
jgi:hypothetical protein